VITFLKRLAASVAAPAAGKVRFFVDSADGLPKYRDESGALGDFVGPQGPIGPEGPAGAGNPEFPIVGGVSAVGGNATTSAGYGDATCDAPVRIPYAGEVLAITLSLNGARTAGTCTAAIVIDGVPQLLPGQTATVDGTNTQAITTVLSTPIPFAANAHVGARTTTVAFAPTGADATISVWIRKT